MKQVFIHLLIIGLLFSCKEKPEEMQMKAEAEFQRLKLILENERWVECRNATIQQAEIIVDSIMFDWNINPLGENQYQPNIPVKPEFIETDTAVLNKKRQILPLDLARDSNLIDR